MSDVDLVCAILRVLVSHHAYGKPELEGLHLIELVDDGQAKRPRVWYDAIDIDIDLANPAFSPAAEA